MLQTSHPSRVFRGVHFVLFGFDPVNESKIRFKLVNGGGVDLGHYSASCTHVIVDKITYDDAVCVAARKDRKTLVTALWVEHSADIGMPVDATSVMYRPLKNLNGIPGAKNLIVCLTGYLRQDRDDIMTMVSLMGAQFSKPLVANKVTHLICYKFEGEKYELAKRLGTIKLVNHRWLEDCLKDWVLLPEDKYNKSGFELEMITEEAKDSEEEAEDSKVGQSGGRNISRSPLSSKFGIAATHGLSNSVSEASSIKHASPIPGNKNRSDQDLRLHSVDDMKMSCQTPDVSRRSTSCQLPDACVKTSESKNAGFPSCQDLGLTGNANSSGQQHDLHDHTSESKKLVSDKRSTSASAEGLAHSDEKLSAMSYSRKNQKGFTLPRVLDDCSGIESNNRETSSTKLKASEGIKSTCIEGSRKGNDFIEGDEPISLLPQKRVNEAASTKLKKSKKMSADAKLSIERTPAAKGKSQGLKVTSVVDEPPESDGYFSVGKDGLNKSNPCLISKSAASTSNLLAFDEPISKNASSESAQCDNTYQNSAHVAIQGLNESKVNGGPDITGFGLGQDDNEAGQLNVTKNLECRSSPENKKPLNEESAGRLDLSNEDSNKLIRKSPRKKSFAKRSLGSRPKTGVTAKLKSSVSLNKTTPQSEGVSSSSGSKEIATCDAKKHQASPQNLGVNKLMEQETVSKYEEVAGGRTEFLDDETEAPDEKCEYELGMAVDEELVHLSKKADPATEMKSEAIHQVQKSEEAMPPKRGTDEAEKQKPPSREDSTSKFRVKHPAKKRPATTAKKTTISKKKSEEAVSRDKIPNETRYEAEIEIQEEMSVPADISDNSTIPRNKAETFIEEEKENIPIDGEQDIVEDRNVGNPTNKSSVRPGKINSKKTGLHPSTSESNARVKTEATCFILSGHRLQRKEFQQVIKRLKGRVCRDSHQWSYQATHYIAPDPIRRTEKFFAATASGRWILKTDFLTASSQAGKFMPEEPYEWHKNGLSEDGAINMEAPRKWRLLKERTGHGALYGMRIVVYGDCIAPPLDTLKRVVKAGDGTILATSPPYTRFLGTGIDYAIVSPGMPRVDLWVQEFLKHEIPCVVADYLVEYVCKPGFSLERHVLYGTHTWAERSFAKLQSRAEEIIEELIAPEDGNDNDITCQVCGSRDRGDVMLICGDESGSVGCGIGTHIDCCDPPLTDVPEEDWFCPKCSSTKNCSNNPRKKKKGALSLSKGK
ncbi:Zinc finger, PHD-type [Sesbania bispinosa]|nr:Zinc finger, PHD-type [Sesbania bispinosa]